MDIKSSSSSSKLYGGATSDEHLMLQKTLFSATLKDLKSLREQLYTAAEHFEESYSREDHKPMVIETCKDYAIKALINTVDHLGSVAFKLNRYIDHTTCEVASMDLRVYSMDQRLKTCQHYINQGGMYQNSLSFTTPHQYHKQYIIPGEEDGTARRRSSSRIEIDFSGSSPSSFLREGYSKLTFPQVFSRQATLPFSWSSTSSTSNGMKMDTYKSSESPQKNPLLRSGSLLVKRSMSPNYANGGKPQNPLAPRRLVSWSEERRRDGGVSVMNEQHSSRSKRLLKSLVSLKRSRKDGPVIYKHLEEI